MIYQIGHNIISSLGFTSEENYSAVKQGISGLKHYENTFDLPENFIASLIDNSKLEQEFSAINSKNAVYTKFEMMIILSAYKAIKNAGINPANDDVIFVLSTTKGNVELLGGDHNFDEDRKYLWKSAQLLCDFFDNSNRPYLASNACISGAAAQITALRLLDNNNYRYAVVVGGEVLSKFVISGFQSFKALSQDFCKPFDQNRTGLNLGEAAATIVYSKEVPAGETVILKAGAIANDANHISGPSRTGLGLTNAIKKILPYNASEKLAFINAHGTATLYNDDMESIALTNCELQNCNVNSLKGYFGHTLGAAGVLETIISSLAICDHTILKTKGLDQRGTANAINSTLGTISTEKQNFMKLLSGFGGTNAAMYFERKPAYKIVAYSKLNNKNLVVDDKIVATCTSEKLSDWFTEVYHALGLNYMKFFKMDRLSKAGFLAAESLLQNRITDRETVKTDWAIAIANSSASLDDDTHYQTTIQNADNYYPSPAVFVYTLANIVAGEIAIRNKIGGETSFYISENCDAKQIKIIAENALADSEIKTVLTGWVEHFGETTNVILMLVEKDGNEKIEFNELEISKLINK